MHAGDRPNSSSCSTQQRRGSGGGQLGAIEAGRPSLVSSIRLFVPWWLCVVWVRHVLGCGAVWCCFWAVFVGCVAWCLSDLLLHLIIALVLFIPAVKFELLPIFGFFFLHHFLTCGLLRSIYYLTENGIPGRYESVRRFLGGTCTAETRIYTIGWRKTHRYTAFWRFYKRRPLEFCL